MNYCYVCRAPLGPAVYENPTSQALTSLCEIRTHPLTVRQCRQCGHVQSDDLGDSKEFYDQQYDILTQSEDEDQIYQKIGDHVIYRLQHQANVVLEKVDLAQGAKVLDFGAAKGASLKRICEIRNDIEPHFFDVSERYIPFWQRLVTEQHWACYEVPMQWRSRFDLVTSFFVAEHVSELENMLSNIHRVLKPDGDFFLIVPNVLENIADLIVVDHANHFTVQSLSCLLSRNGFVDIDIDASCYEGALTATAKRGEATMRQQLAETDEPLAQSPDAIEDTSIAAIARYWTAAGESIRAFERTLPPTRDRAIYGAGFYGSYIYSVLEQPERIAGFVDANQHLVGKTRFGKPIWSPNCLPTTIADVFVGLNPRTAGGIMQEWERAKESAINLFTLDVPPVNREAVSSK